MPKGIPKNPKAAKAKRAKTRKANNQKTKMTVKDFAVEATGAKKTTRFPPVEVRSLKVTKKARVTKTATGTVIAGWRNAKKPRKVIEKKPSITWPRAAPSVAFDEKINPAHYVGDSGQQVIDVLEDFNLINNRYRGHAIQYMFRAGNKIGENTIADLEKARWFIAREIRRLNANAKV